jgi:segregation and condensation protein B
MRRIRVTRDNEAPPTGETPADEAAAGETAADEYSDGTVIDLTAAIAERGEGNADAALAAADAATAEGQGEEETTGPIAFEQLEPLIESLLFASDRPLSVADLKRLTGERDSRLINEALQALTAKRADSGIQLLALGGGFALRTNPAFADWVGKLLAAKPVRLSRAMLETLSIVAYRQPITRPEIDDIRGVDCGPVLKTLLDRNLIRIIGKKEEVGRPMLYGTSPEFLRIFSLKDLTQLPTLRQFHELSAEHQAKVDAEHGGAAAPDAGAPLVDAPAMSGPLTAAAPTVADPEEDDGLLESLEEASAAASRAAGPLHPEAAEPPPGQPTQGGPPDAPDARGS